MPRLTNHQKKDWELFLNPITHRRAYNSLCRRCVHECKQTYQAIVIDCKRYRSKRSR